MSSMNQMISIYLILIFLSVIANQGSLERYLTKIDLRLLRNFMTIKKVNSLPITDLLKTNKLI